jgi:hypothetical protein
VGLWIVSAIKPFPPERASNERQKMKTSSQNFTSMKGHVADGCVIVAPSGREFTLKNHIKGWMIYRDGQPVSGYLPSAADVEFFVVNGLYSH